MTRHDIVANASAVDRGPIAAPRSAGGLADRDASRYGRRLVRRGLRASWQAGAAALVAAAAALACAAAPASAADWLPAFELGTPSVDDTAMSLGGDIAAVVGDGGARALRFRPAGGPLGPAESVFPAGAHTVRIGLDAAGDAAMVWTRAGTAETRTRRRDGTLTAIQAVQAGVSDGSPRIAVARSGRAVIAWLSGDSARTLGARTVAADGTLGPALTVSLPAEKTREFDLGIDGAGNATLAWTTPDAPPNTKVKARRLSAAGALSTVADVSAPPAPELSDTPLVAVDPAGNATIVWRHITATFASLTETRQFSAAGVLGSTQILTPAGFSSQGHDVAVDDAGRARITWAERTSGSTDPFLPVTCFSAVGSSCGAKLPLSGTTGLITRVAVAPSGDAVVGYTGSQPARVRALPRPSGGSPLPERTLGTAAQLSQVAVDAEGNGVAVWTEDGAAKATGFDAAPPVVERLTVPLVAERAVPVAASAAVRDVWGATSQWTFGDGATASGPSVRHAYQRTGTFPVQVTATDGAGATATAAATVTVRDTVAPALGRVTLRRTRFRVAAAPTARSARARRRPAPRGSDLRFALGEAAAVAVAVQRRTIGRRAGRTCQRARGPIPRGRRCVRFVAAGRILRRSVAAGFTRVAFTGRIGRRPLRPGAYRVRVQATDAAGNRSSVRTAAFTIVK